MRHYAFVAVFALFAFYTPAFAMDGVNVDTGDAVTADDGTNFVIGQPVTLYDAEGNEMSVVVQGVKQTDAGLDVDVQDQDSGDTATIEFAN